MSQILVAQDVPTLIVKAAVPLFAAIDGEVQNVVAVGAVALITILVIASDVVACSVVNFPVEAAVDPIEGVMRDKSKNPHRRPIALLSQARTLKKLRATVH